MKLITLVRVASSDKGTFGVLLVDQHIPFAVTLELPWKNNQQNISCIPADDYICVPVDSPKFGQTYEITNVPGRSHILFHGGNELRDTKGCILVGEKFQSWGESPVISDRRGFKDLMDLTTGMNFQLVIIDFHKACALMSREIR